MNTSEDLVACSTCFTNEGLRLDAERLGESDSSTCPRCAAVGGRKLNSERLITLAQHFFVWGSLWRYKYGAAPAVQFNDRRKTDLAMPRSLRADAALFEDILGIGFFSYGPRYWMWGEIEPLKGLQCEESRNEVIDRILREYSPMKLTTKDQFCHPRPRAPRC